MISVQRDSLLTRQSASGAFPSTVGRGLAATRDETCFVTAWVGLLLLEHATPGEADGARPAIGRACDFVESCETSPASGRFRFYPRRGSSRRLRIALAADTDDTALAWTLLLGAGRRERSEARRRLPSLLTPQVEDRVPDTAVPRRRPGMVLTWFDARNHNPVDVTVNANIAGLLAMAGLRDHRLYRELVASLSHALAPPGLQRRFRLLSPYYAHPLELLYALESAVAHGSEEMRPVLERLRTEPWTRDDLDLGRALDRPLCCNDHGRPQWRSRVLQGARAWASSVRSRPSLSTFAPPQQPDFDAKETLRCT